MSSQPLRDGIRSGAIRCECPMEVRGFVVVQTDDGPVLLYQRRGIAEHAKRCPWAAAVFQIYKTERT